MSKHFEASLGCGHDKSLRTSVLEQLQNAQVLLNSANAATPAATRTAYRREVARWRDVEARMQFFAYWRNNLVHTLGCCDIPVITLAPFRQKVKELAHLLGLQAKIQPYLIHLGGP